MQTPSRWMRIIVGSVDLQGPAQPSLAPVLFLLSGTLLVFLPLVSAVIVHSYFKSMCNDDNAINISNKRFRMRKILRKLVVKNYL